jgi:hypothetical protein
VCIATWYLEPYPILEKESSHLYGSALGELRKTISLIGYRKLVAPEATLASILILSTYEVGFVLVIMGGKIV